MAFAAGSDQLKRSSGPVAADRPGVWPCRNLLRRLSLIPFTTNAGDQPRRDGMCCGGPSWRDIDRSAANATGALWSFNSEHWLLSTFRSSKDGSGRALRGPGSGVGPWRMDTLTIAPFLAFRTALASCLGRRRDALFEFSAAAPTPVGQCLRRAASRRSGCRSPAEPACASVGVRWPANIRRCCQHLAPPRRRN